MVVSVGLRSIAAGVLLLSVFGAQNVAHAENGTKKDDPSIFWPGMVGSGGFLSGGHYAFAFGVGPNFGGYKSSYAGTGGQAPGNFSASHTGGSGCGGFNAYYPVGSSRLEIGGGINVCQDFGEVTLFDIIRHGATGRVVAKLDPGARVEGYVGVHYNFPRQPAPQASVLQIDHLLFRMGPVFLRNNLKVTSDQVPGGGVLEQASSSYWATGFGIAGGAAFKLCTNCFGGNPLSLNLIGRAAWFNTDHSIDLRSSTFGFVEHVQAEHFHQYGFSVNLSTPLGFTPRYQF